MTDFATIPTVEDLSEKLVDGARLTYGDWTVVVRFDGIVLSVDTAEGTEEGIFWMDRAAVEDETGRPSQQETATWAAEAIVDYWNCAQAAADGRAEEEAERREEERLDARYFGSSW